MFKLRKRNKTALSLLLVSVILTLSFTGCGIEAPKDNILWINGTYAVVTAVNGNDPTIFGGVEKNKQSTDESIAILESDWDITNKEELDETIEELKNGMHNVEFIEFIKSIEFDTMSKEELDLILEQVDDPEMVACLELFYDIYAKFGENSILAWDQSRAVSLCSFGYLAGYYTYDEAVAEATNISKQIQTTFDSWDSFYQSYMCGYEYWSEEDVLDENSNYSKRSAIVEGFKNDPDSFYHLDWNLDLDAK